MESDLRFGKYTEEGVHASSNVIPHHTVLRIQLNLLREKHRK